MAEVEVYFSGTLADITGTAVKHYSNVKSTDDLKLRVRDDFPQISHYDFIVLINNRISKDTETLRSGDQIDFLLPNNYK